MVSVDPSISYPQAPILFARLVCALRSFSRSSNPPYPRPFQRLERWPPPRGGRNTYHRAGPQAIEELRYPCE